MYGLSLPDGLRDNEALPHAVITHRQQGLDGGHDEPLSEQEIVGQGLLTKSQWDEVSTYALALLRAAKDLCPSAD